MDSLTHGLLGAATAALPLPRRFSDPSQAVRTTRAALVVAVLAAELPDIDYLVPASDAVLRTIHTHRGLTHSLLGVPFVALAATVLTKLWFRQARAVTLYVRALVAVPVAHLLPDLWTGWGTRLFLPFSERRLALDWTMVIDPFFTVPFVVAAAYAWFRRERWRTALAAAAAIAVAYLALRVASASILTESVRRTYPNATAVSVFPAPLALRTWRYVVRFDGAYAAGYVGLGLPPIEKSRLTQLPAGPLPAALAKVPTVEEALAWARFPIVRVTQRSDSLRSVEIADLRYHLDGRPTLSFVIDIAGDGSVRAARLERGGSVADFLRRWLAPA